jgi:hypothetical protein
MSVTNDVTEMSVSVSAPRASDEGYVTGVADGGAQAPSTDLPNGATAGGNGLVIIRYLEPDSGSD